MEVAASLADGLRGHERNLDACRHVQGRASRFVKTRAPTKAEGLTHGCTRHGVYGTWCVVEEGTWYINMATSKGRGPPVWAN